MIYLDVLREVHRLLQPRNYLEIGVNHGWSMSLSTTRSIGVDPDFHVDTEIRAPVSLIRRTSDDFFAELPSTGPFDGQPVDFAFIDGMHHFEFALRDFINTERLCTWSSVIVFDDVLPPDQPAADRERKSNVWAGDVFKVEQVLRRYRPDLNFLTLDTEFAGLLLVFGADPDNQVLAAKQEELAKKHVTPDPQEVPDEVFKRVHAIQPEVALTAPVWSIIREQRDVMTPDEGRKAIRESLQGLDKGTTGGWTSRIKHLSHRNH